jgi:hypothetical protein
MIELKGNFGQTNVDIFQYMQLKSFISRNYDLKHQNSLEGIVFESENYFYMMVRYTTSQRAYPTNNLLEKRRRERTIGTKT